MAFVYILHVSSIIFFIFYTHIFQWVHSLLELDISWMSFPASELEDAIEVLVAAGKQDLLKLNTLNMAGTGVVEEQVRYVTTKRTYSDNSTV